MSMQGGGDSGHKKGEENEKGISGTSLDQYITGKKAKSQNNRVNEYRQDIKSLLTEKQD